MWFSRSTVLTIVRDDLLCSPMNVLDMTDLGFLLIAAASVMLSVDAKNLLVRTVRIRVSRAIDDLLVLCGTTFGVLLLRHTVVAYLISMVVVILSAIAYVMLNAPTGRFLVDGIAVRVASVYQAWSGTTDLIFVSAASLGAVISARSGLLLAGTAASATFSGRNSVDAGL